MSFILKTFSVLLLVTIIGGFAFAAITDVEISKQEITKPLNYEQYIQK